MPGPVDSHIVFLRTHDLPATSKFYERTLGLPLVLDQGGCRIFRVAGDAHLGFCDREGPLATDGVVVTLVTEDVDGWCAALRDKGVAFEKEPARNPEYRIYHAFLRDPNGYLVEIQRFEDPQWGGRSG